MTVAKEPDHRGEYEGTRKTIAWGMPGAWCARRRMCEDRKQKSTRVSQVTPKTPSTPRAMVLTASFVLSPATGLFCHRRP